MTNLTAWWAGLSDEARDRLMNNPFGFVPPDLISADGPAAVGAWWPETQSGPAGLEFPHKVQVFIESKRLRKVHDDLEAERRDLLDRYFPIGDGHGPLVVGEGFPDKETEMRYHELGGLIVDARRAWIEWIVENR